MLYYILDIFLELFHASFILFNLFGWIFPATRKVHFGAMILTTFSWLGLGYWYGWGYCFCTDMHWHIKRQLGHSQLPASYISYVCDNYFNFQPTTSLVNWVSSLVFASCFLLTMYFNFQLKKD